MYVRFDPPCQLFPLVMTLWWWSTIKKSMIYLCYYRSPTVSQPVCQTNSDCHSVGPKYSKDINDVHDTHYSCTLRTSCKYIPLYLLSKILEPAINTKISICSWIRSFLENNSCLWGRDFPFIVHRALLIMLQHTSIWFSFICRAPWQHL